MIASPGILARTLRQVGLEASSIGRFAPDVVLSDSSLPTVIAGKLHRLPTFTVLNQLDLNSSHDGEGPLKRLLSLGTSFGMGELWEMSDEVLLPDLPPPFTISERNLWGSNVEKTRYVGFLGPSSRAGPDAAAKEFAADPKPKVFWQVSGPPMTRGPLIKRALECAGALSGDFAFVISGGDPTSSSEPTRVEGGWYYGWCGIAEYYFGACDVVVSRAGHGTIGQTIGASKPSLIIPIPGQPEQEGNAEKAVRIGISLKLSQDALTVRSLSEAVEELLNGAYGDKARRLSEWASRFDATGEVVRTIEAAAAGRRGPR